MDTNIIFSLLSENKNKILSYPSKAARIDAVIELIQKEFPEVSYASAIYGPITSLPAYQNYIESRTIIDRLMKLKQFDGRALFVGDNAPDYVEILSYIQDFIE